MVSELKLVITENDKVIDTVVKETQTHPSQIIESINEFRQLVNNALTKLIEDPEDSSDYMDDEDVSEEDEADVQISPKKKRNK